MKTTRDSFVDNRQTRPSLKSIHIEGFRPFGVFDADLGDLEVIVGANASGKSSLFEFLRFLRDAASSFEIPSEIVPGSIGKEIFHRPGPDKFSWTLRANLNSERRLFYHGELLGPVGRPRVPYEMARKAVTDVFEDPINEDIYFSSRRGQRPPPQTPGPEGLAHPFSRTDRSLGLSMMRSSEFELSDLNQYITGWRFYSAFNIDEGRLRSPGPIEQEPVLREDCGNLTSVLFFLMNEHPDLFSELQSCLKSTVPGFQGLSVKARGGPGQVMGFWQEGSVNLAMTLADLSDGVIRLICWFVLCFHPFPPPLICIDEPDLGLHPRALPVLAALLQKAAHGRTQFLIATHCSHFLTEFPFESIAVLRRERGDSHWVKPRDSFALRESLKEFGYETLETMHRTDELEILP